MQQLIKISITVRTYYNRKQGQNSKYFRAGIYLRHRKPRRSVPEYVHDPGTAQ